MHMHIHGRYTLVWYMCMWYTLILYMCTCMGLLVTYKLCIRKTSATVASSAAAIWISVYSRPPVRVYSSGGQPAISA